MLFYSTLVLLVAEQISLSLSTSAPSQDELQQCSQLPLTKNPRKCCDIPPVFSKDNFKFCNLVDNFEQNTEGGVVDCTRQLCILNTLNFIKDGDKIDRNAVLHFMDIWADANPNYAAITRHGKARCLGEEIPGPKEVCEANRFVSCIATSAIMMCPKWVLEDEDCKTLKNHIDKCANYF